MSYCRFSSDNWKSDVYVYEADEGWVTHVAARRRMFAPVPDILPSRLAMWVHEWSGCYWDVNARCMKYPRPWRAAIYKAWSHFIAFWHNRIHMGSLHMIPLRPIGLPADGEGYCDPTPGECADRLERLSRLGYRVPSWAIESLREEQQ
jgi:hypothetical protein